MIKIKNNVISLEKYNNKKEPKMLLVIILLSVISAIFIWQKYVESEAALDVEIPQSLEISYNETAAIASTSDELSQIFLQNQQKPIIFYLYTTWCGVCKKNFAVINEIAREFQNTDLKVVALAIDKDISGAKLMNYLSSNGKFYFEPRFLRNRDGFGDFLQKFRVKYRGVIPYTIIISRDGKIRTKYNGVKNLRYLKRKIIAELYN